VWSYVDQLGVAVLTDDQTFNDPHEATDALIEDFAELHSATGLSDQNTGLDLTAEHALR
jgi:diacylglycerol O-acyltransferase / wax synthase